MEISGTIKKIYPIKEVTSKTSGEVWKTMDIVIEEEGERYPQSACLQLSNDNCTRFNLKEGMKVLAKFDIRCREWEGKSYNTLNAWNITVIR